MFEQLPIVRPAANKGSSAFQPPFLWVPWVEGPDINRRWLLSPQVANFRCLNNVQAGFVKVMSCLLRRPIQREIYNVNM